MKTTLVVIGVFLLSNFGIGQSVVFNVSPKEAFVRISGEVLDLTKKKQLSLPPGTYEAEIWAPNFEIYREEVIVETGKTTVVNHGMKNTTSAYKDYLESLSQYNTAKLKRALVGGALVSGTLASAYVAVTGRRNRLNDIEQLIDNRRAAYQNALNPAIIEQFGKQYTLAVDDHGKTQTQHNGLVVAGSVLAIAGATATFLYFRSKRGENLMRPTVIDENPFTSINERSGAFLAIGTTSSPVGLTLNF